MKTFDKRNIKLWTQLFKQWLSAKFEAIATAIANIDLSPISDDIADVKSDVADVKGDVGDVKTAVENIDFSTLAKQGTNPNATNTAILAKFDDITIDTSNLATKAVEQWLGLEESYEAEAKGGERTNNTVIDECKVRFQDAFNGLLPTGFTMPNSVTVDNLTYTGTTNS